MPDGTFLPKATQLVLYQWSRKAAPKPKLAAPIDADDTTLSFSVAFKDEDDAVLASKAFSFGLRKGNGWVETCLVTSGILLYDAQTANFTVGEILTGGTSGAKALIVEDTDDGTTGTLNLIIISGTFQDDETITDSATGSATANGTLTNSLSADGLTASNVIRGIDPGGLNWYVGSADFADSHDEDEPVFANIPAFLPELLRAVVQGLIATGASNFIIGIDEAGTVTLSRSSGVGESLGFLRWASNKAQYSNDGVVWTNIEDAAASVIFKVSSNDTTSGYAEDKIVAGTGITITVLNDGANETLEISTSLPTTISAHLIYTPAYLTGDTGAETTIALWDSISDGSFRITIDGTAYNVDGIDFTAAHGDGIVTDMDEVAERIQSSIRALTGSTETCVWSTDHFIITSADVSSSSEVSVTSTSTGTVGTDISGAGASDWMDCDTGNGTATATVLDKTADAGKLVALDAGGNFAIGIPSGVIVPYAGSTAPSGWLLCDGTTGLDATSDATLLTLWNAIGTTFGGTGVADFDLPDMRGNMPLGKDNMGGSSRNRVTHANADTIGAEEGAEDVTLTAAESGLPAHSHYPRYTTGAGGVRGADRVGTGDGGTETNHGVSTSDNAAAPASSAHENMPPYMTLNYIIKK